MFVYVIVNSATLKIYVGQHKGNNLRQYLQQKQSEAERHLSLRSKLYASMRKHGHEVWGIHPLVSDLQTRVECDEWERHYIKVLKAQHSDVGYNICDGGEGFTGPHTDEWKQQMSERMMGRFMSPETRAKISAANTGKHLYPRTPENEVRRLAGLQIAVAQGKMSHGNGMRGKRHSPETLAKMRSSAQARGISPETHQKMLAARAASGWNVGHPDYTTSEGVEKARAAKTGKPWSEARRQAYENKTSKAILEA